MESTKQAAGGRRRKQTEEQPEQPYVLPPEAFQGANGEAPPPVTEVSPQQQFEGELTQLINRFIPVLGALYVAKMLGMTQVDVMAFYAERTAQAVGDRAVQVALTKSGKSRRQPSPQNKATRKRKK